MFIEDTIVNQWDLTLNRPKLPHIICEHKGEIIIFVVVWKQEILNGCNQLINAKEMKANLLSEIVESDLSTRLVQD